ncbi:SDR family oxidoreductase [Actinoplanes sp. NPDC051851]|uniref:SDR family oxidoreductase n=1 Tax=Actinoplanes sp. NPDC051851 TaxID=3154753 RepID=UPI00344946F2
MSILIVGGTSGIGLATARRLAATGADVHVASRDAAKVAAIAATDPELVAHRLDGGDGPAVAELGARLAPLDALIVTLAGAEGSGTLAELDLDSLRRAFEAKYWPTLIVLKNALPHLAERASITLVGAVSAHAFLAGVAGIGSLNAAVEGLVRPLAAELAPRRVNAVSPGLVDTPWWNGLSAGEREAWFSAAAEALPVGHVSTADEIAEAVVLAATSTSMTEAVLNVDGGARFARF